MIWRFGDFEVDDHRREISRQGRPLPLSSKPFALLVELLRAHPEPLSREVLSARLWSDVSVTPASLDRAASLLRRAIADGEEAGAELRTIRGFGYQLAGGVERIGAASEGVPREVPMRALREALASARDGAGAVVLITGEPGIGKSHLVEHFVATTSAPSLVSVGRTADGDAPPYWEWRSMLGEVAAALPQARLRAATRGREVSLRAVAPEIGEIPGVGRGASQHPESISPVQLWDDVARFLGDASRFQPLVLVLEDLHWAGAESLQLLRHLSRHVVPSAAVLLVATYRDRGAPPNPELDAALASLVQQAHVRPIIAPDPFDEAEVAEFVALETSLGSLGDLVPELTRWTGGNPLFVREVARLLETRPEHARRLEVPPGAAAVVRERTAQLGAATRHLLELASLCVGARSLSVLAHAAGRDEREVWRDLGEARRAGLVELLDAETYRFTHDVVRDALSGQIPRERRGALHRAVADAIEAVHVSWLDPHLAELAHHLSEARPLVDEARVFQRARAAARRARECASFVEETRHQRRALAVTSARTPQEAARRCDVLLDLAEAETRAGGGDRAAPVLQEASAIARGLGDGPRLGRAALLHSAWAVPILADPHAIASLEEALSVLGEEEPALRLRLQAQLALQRRFAGEPEEGDRLLAEVLEHSIRVEDPSLRAALRTAHLDAIQQGPRHEACEDRLQLADHAMADAIDASLPELALRVRRHRISILCELGEGDAIEREIEHFERIGQGHSRSQRYYAAAFRAGRQLLDGLFDEARIRIARAEAVADPRDPSESLFTPATQRLLLPLSPGEAAQLASTIEDIVAAFPFARGWRTGLGLVYLHQGRRDEARRRLDVDLRRGVAAFLLDNMTDPMVLAALTTLSHALADSRHAAELHALLEPHGGRNVDVGYGIACYGPIDYYRGLAATLLGRREEALAHFEAASALNRRTGSRLWEVRNRIAWSRLLGESPHAGQRDRARSLAAEARTQAEQMGLRREAAELGSA